MKTIRQWFEELPEPYREKAIRNMEEQVLTHKHIYPDNKVYDQETALYSGFVWSSTEEGIEYWSDVVRKSNEGRLS